MSELIKNLIADMIVSKYYGERVTTSVASKIADDIAKALEKSIVNKD